MIKLLSFGFRYYKTHKLYSQGEAITDAELWGGDADVVKLIAKDDVYVTVPRSQKDDVTAEMELTTTEPCIHG